MSDKANPMVIGGFVLGALVLLVAAILLFGSGAMFRTADRMVSYFPGTVQGLRVGAPVQYRGVQIGRVTAIRADLYADQSRVVVPVYYELWPDTLRIVEGELDENRARGYQRAIERVGLRAQLTSVSLVTGQYLVSLVSAPETPVKLERTSSESDTLEIPTIPATRDRLSDMLRGLDLDKLVNATIGAFQGIEALTQDREAKNLAGNANQLMERIQELVVDLDAGAAPLMQKADTTLSNYSDLAKVLGSRADQIATKLEVTLADISTLSRNIDAEVDPVSRSMRAALGDAARAFRSIEDLLGSQSSTRYDLDLLLKEGAGAARSLRLLADYLEQNPDALIKGRY